MLLLLLLLLAGYHNDGPGVAVVEVEFLSRELAGGK